MKVTAYPMKYWSMRASQMAMKSVKRAEPEKKAIMAKMKTARW